MLETMFLLITLLKFRAEQLGELSRCKISGKAIMKFSIIQTTHSFPDLYRRIFIFAKHCSADSLTISNCWICFKRESSHLKIHTAKNRLGFPLSLELTIY